MSTSNARGALERAPSSFRPEPPSGAVPALIALLFLTGIVWLQVMQWLR